MIKQKIIAVAVIVFLSAISAYFIFDDYLIRNVIAASKQALVVPKILPVVKVARLKIPKIKVDAPVIYAGLTPAGEIAVPKGPVEVSWFNLGPKPGEIGSAIISGHYGWKDKIPAVFDNLSKLKKGDKVTFQDEKGVTTTFVVRATKIYSQNAKATEVFVSTDGKAHLNLITCGGVWDKKQKSYSTRLVVFTDKI